MVRIHLARHGRKGRPFFHIIVADSRFAPGKRFIEKVGYYNGLREDFSECAVELDRIEYWQSQGARLTPQVKSIYKHMKNRSASSE
ncbi:30S ribosomal protein S16 [Gammaproteobacteria bacterium]|nr:30S ribosomal protein S16 [Gammaproteobacteria bacterium]